MRRTRAFEEFCDSLYQRGASVSNHSRGLVSVSPNSNPPKVTDATLKLLKGSKLVGGVDFHGCVAVTDSGLASLGGCTNLKGLHLDGTQITDAGLVHLKGLTQLKRLGLSETQITDAGLIHVRGLRNLTRINLYDTRVTDEGVKNLQEALPNCTINR